MKVYAEYMNCLNANWFRFPYANLIYFIAMISLISSCQQVQSSDDSDMLMVNVTNSSGDDFLYQKGDSTFFFAPFPFNVGILEKDSVEYEMMVLSRKAKVGTDLHVLPLAKLTLTDPDQEQKDIFVAVPVNKADQIFDGETFYDFSVGQFSFKQIIEYWYANRYGLQGTVIEGWAPISEEYFNEL